VADRFFWLLWLNEDIPNNDCCSRQLSLSNRAVLTNGHVPRAPGFFFLRGPTGWGEIIILKLIRPYLITFAKINCKGNPENTF